MTSLANAEIYSHSHAQTHKMDNGTDKVAIRPPPPLDPDLSSTPRDSMIGLQNAELLVYFDVFGAARLLNFFPLHGSSLLSQGRGVSPGSKRGPIP